MTPPGHRILVVDDDEAMCLVLAEGLASRGYEIVWTTRPADALAKLDADVFDAMLVDLTMPRMDGLQLARAAVERQPSLVVVVLTAYGSLDAAVGALRAGAYDFIAKPIDLDVLRIALERALNHAALRREVRALRSATSPARAYGPLLGESRPMRRIYEVIDRCADSDATVLVQGESGTGKELVARAVHLHSHRCDGPFAAINCAAIPEGLIESELFGHVAGAFTGASRARLGLLATSRGGTVLLDEVGELPLAAQAKLLRVLQDRIVRPVGADDEVEVDVRIIAATNVDLEEAVAARRFREDLLYRLDVLSICVPPLRARGNDILLLADQFLREAAARVGRGVLTLDVDAARAIAAYRWPGNVRELRSCMERAATFCRGSLVGLEDLPEKVHRGLAGRGLLIPDETEGYLTVAELERRYVLAVLEAFGGNKTEAGRVLGLDRRTIGRKLRSWGIPG